jgi:hypothetical protein
MLRLRLSRGKSRHYKLGRGGELLVLSILGNYIAWRLPGNRASIVLMATSTSLLRWLHQAPPLSATCPSTSPPAPASLLQVLGPTKPVVCNTWHHVPCTHCLCTGPAILLLLVVCVRLSRKCWCTVVGVVRLTPRQAVSMDPWYHHGHAYPSTILLLVVLLVCMLMRWCCCWVGSWRAVLMGALLPTPTSPTC